LERNIVSNLEHALNYGRMGIGVFPVQFIDHGQCSCGKPCSAPGKHPLTLNGHKDATTDLDRIAAIWRSCPNANVGVRTGIESNLLVLDADGAKGIADVGQWEAENGPLPLTPTATTGGGGKHWYFSYPEGCGLTVDKKISGTSIDYRGEGGYVIAPSSSHISGGFYRWDIALGETPLASPPARLIDWLRAGKTRRSSVAVPSPESGSDLFTELTQRPDLRTAPGVSEGSRHGSCCQLVGQALADGHDSLTVYGWALGWAGKCTPPMDADEVHRIVSDLAKKDAAKAESLPAIVEAPWPVLNPAALYGLPGEIVRAIQPQTEADPAAILMQTLVFFGSVVGRNPYFLVEGTKHYPNLFTVLVGDTARGRKGTSEGRVRELFRPVDQQWLGHCLAKGLQSGEGVVWHVRDASEKEEPIKEKGLTTGYQKVIADHGVDDKRLLVVEPEFASVLRITRRDGNILSPMLREAWDTGDLRQLTKNASTKATGAHVSIIGHITKEELLRSLTDVESLNGFANRFCWVCVKRRQLLPEGGTPISLAAYSERLSVAAEKAKATGQLRRDGEAAEIWHDFYKQADNGPPGLLGAVTCRSEAQVLRLSMIYALLDGANVISAEHLRAAIALWQYAADSACHVFGSSTGDSLADKVLAVMREGPCTKTTLYNRMNGHCSKSNLDRALDKLKRHKLIKAERRATGGRPAEWLEAA
jgi:Bifunctional DNA primase/polymerase, N-terminal/Protein of unknown function (DUF3987)